MYPSSFERFKNSQLKPQDKHRKLQRLCIYYARLWVESWPMTGLYYHQSVVQIVSTKATREKNLSAQINMLPRITS